MFGGKIISALFLVLLFFLTQFVSLTFFFFVCIFTCYIADSISHARVLLFLTLLTLPLYLGKSTC